MPSLSRLARWWCLAGVAALGTAASRADDVPAQQSTDGRALLIIAPEQFAAVTLGYAAWKSQQLETIHLTLEQALAESEGVDDAERLKRLLYRAWREQNVGYVLLVGDADVLPVRYMTLDRITPAAYDYAFYPSDLYYSDLAKPDGSFETWNASTDGFHAGYFGEVRGEKNKSDPINFDEVDYRPEIAVGRWPVSTLEQATVVVQKSVRYERDLLERRRTASPSAALISVGGWVDSRPTLDRVADSLPDDWRVERCYFVDRTRNDQTPPPDENELCRLLNAGVGVVFHAGHGTDTSWQECFRLELLDQVQNESNLPIMISAGCSTARLATLPPYEAYVDRHGVEHHGSDQGEVFTAPPPPPACYQPGRFNTTGLGEGLLRNSQHGAVAYIGCNTGSQPCGLTLLEGVAQGFGEPGPRRLGDCWSRAIAHYYEAERLADLKPDADWYPPSIFFQGMKFMLYGDPSLLLPDEAAR